MIFETVVNFVIGHYLQRHEIPSEYEIQCCLKLKEDRVQECMSRMANQGMILDGKLNLHFWAEKFIAQICVLSIPSRSDHVKTLLPLLNAVIRPGSPLDERGKDRALRQYVQKYGFDHVKSTISYFLSDRKRVILHQFEEQLRQKGVKRTEHQNDDEHAFSGYFE